MHKYFKLHCKTSDYFWFIKKVPYKSQKRLSHSTQVFTKLSQNSKEPDVIFHISQDCIGLEELITWQ